MEKLLANANDMLAVQGQSGNWNYDPYMHGVYNGIEMIIAIFEKREPKFRDAPDVWLKSIKFDATMIQQKKD